AEPLPGRHAEPCVSRCTAPCRASGARWHPGRLRGRFSYRRDVKLGDRRLLSLLRRGVGAALAHCLPGPGLRPPGRTIGVSQTVERLPERGIRQRLKGVVCRSPALPEQPHLLLADVLRPGQGLIRDRHDTCSRAGCLPWVCTVGRPLSMSASCCYLL